VVRQRVSVLTMSSTAHPFSLLAFHRLSTILKPVHNYVHNLVEIPNSYPQGEIHWSYSGHLVRVNANPIGVSYEEFQFLL
jgi:hypothetical protein